MKSRAIVSITIALIFIGMAVTGIMSYFTKYDETLSAVHTIFSLLFVGTALFHIFNNHKPLRNYCMHNKTRIFSLVLPLVIGCVLVGALFSIPPFKNIIEFGKSMRQQDEISKKTEYVITTKSKEIGKNIKIDFRAGSEYLTKKTLSDGRTLTLIPQVAVWLQDETGRYLETLYISGKSATGNYSGGKNRRPGALPVWSHARNIKSSDGLMMPDSNNAVSDAVSGATPLTGYSVVSKYPQDRSLKLMIECNKSFDFNDHFNKKNFAHDSTYVKNPNGQPSLVYSADLNENTELVLAHLIGHGHISGADGAIHADVSHITSAVNIFKGIIIETDMGIQQSTHNEAQSLF
ncbi:MAG: DUF4405 domain-containing protein [Reichenbachiella sp.]